MVRGTIDTAKFVLSIGFLLCVGTCVYVCGEVGKAGKSDNVSSSAYVAPTVTPTVPAPEAPAPDVDKSEQFMAALEANLPAAKSPREARDIVAREFSNLLRDDGVELRAADRDGTTLEFVKYVTCNRESLDAMKKGAGGPFAKIGFTKMRCGTAGAEVSLMPKRAERPTAAPGRASPAAEEYDPTGDLVTKINAEIGKAGDVDLVGGDLQLVTYGDRDCAELAAALNKKHATSFVIAGIRGVVCPRDRELPDAPERPEVREMPDEPTRRELPDELE